MTDMSLASLSVSEDGSVSSDSELDSSTSIDHTHAKFHKMLAFLNGEESNYSLTQSENLHGDTQGSISRGTSGDLSLLSTVSIDLVPYIDFYENEITTATEDDLSVGTSYEILSV